MKFRLPAAIATLAAILLSLVWVVAPASAHTPDVNPQCDHLTVDLRNYNQNVHNEVSVSVDGVLLTNKETFTKEFKKTYSFDRYVAHTYQVTVTAGDDLSGSKGWTFDTGLKATTPCEDDNPDEVELCHATPPDTAANGWELKEVSKNAVLKNGHSGHSKDIIRSFSYLEKGVTKLFPGLNWDADGQAIYDHGCKRLEATPVVPTVTQSTECAVQGSLTIPTTTGVEYLLGGEVVSGTLNGPLTGTLTAQAAPGYKLATTNWTFNVNIPVAAKCPVAVTPVNPTVTQSTECAVQGSLTIPTTTGVEYLLGGEVVSGTLNGPLTGTLTAQAAPGYKLATTNWTFNVNIPVAAKCPVAVTPVNPTVTQSTECAVQGSLTIPTTTGVEYLLGGEVVSGTLNGPLTGTLTAQAAPGYKLATTNWTFNVNIPAAADCKPTPQPTPTPTEVGVLHQTAPAAPAPAAGAALATTGSSLHGFATAAVAALLAGTVLMMASRRRREVPPIAVEAKTD